jgi:hypothetical protein
MIEINKVPYEEDKTEHVRNIGLECPYYDLFNHLDLNKAYHAKWPYPKYQSKEVFKTVFGKQLKCVNYTYRNWVWTFSDKDNQACLNVLCSETGAHFEYRHKSRQAVLKEIIDWVSNKVLNYEKKND